MPVLLVAGLTALGGFLTFLFYVLLFAPHFNPLARLSGPPVKSLFHNQLPPLIEAAISRQVHEIYAKKYGRSIRVRGLGPWDDRLLTLDPVSIAHVLKNPEIYEKPWQSRRLITHFIGCGLLSAEGATHKRQRRVILPAFSAHNMRALVPLVFSKGHELKDKWLEATNPVMDVCHWMNRATFDVVGLADFGYDFNAIQNESDELFVAYREMFEVAVSQAEVTRTLMTIYTPFLNKLFPNKVTRTVDRCQEVIRRVTGEIVRKKKAAVDRAAASGDSSKMGKDLLTLMLQANAAIDLPPESRLSEDDLLNNVNTFMFAGSDTSSLAMSWTLLLLAQHPHIQDQVRAELIAVTPSTPYNDLTEDEIQSLYAIISELPFLNNVVRESARLIPPVHSSLRVATKDDVIPTQYPVHLRNGSTQKTVHIPKGSFVHVGIEAFNLDKEFWGEDAWEFNPDRWDALPDAVAELPGTFSNTLTFSAGQRACVGMRFSVIEIKVFLYVLLTNFMFAETEAKIFKANVVLTRPYLTGKFKEGSQCPLRVTSLA